MPDAAILGNVLYHNHQIIASAKQAAAEAFLDSARFAGVLGEDLVLRPQGSAPTSPSISAPTPHPVPKAPASENGDGPIVGPSRLAVAVKVPARTASSPSDVRVDLRLWGHDAGKAIRVRAPESITPASFDRLIQTLRLLLRIEDPPQIPEPDDDEPDDDRDD